MNIKDISREILSKVNQAESLGKEFDISLEDISNSTNDLSVIKLQPVDKKQSSFTLLVLPELKNFNFATDKLFGDNSEGGEE